MTIAVCIPTYNRPLLLQEAINSCLQQTEVPYEIIIGDDSKNEDSKVLVEEITKNNKSAVVIRYIRNSPSLKQTANVNMLFNAVRSDKLVLLHDDDILIPDALRLMKQCFKENNIDACFGKQYDMSEDGTINLEPSEAASRYYFKTEEYAGSKLSSMDVAISHQFPNDGFMISSELAKKVGYADQKASDACDFVFAFKLGLAGCRFFFINAYTSAYRNTSVSISKQGGDASYVIYQTIAPFKYLKSDVDYKFILLKRHVRQAIVQAVQDKQKGRALKMFFSIYHLSYILTPGGFKRLFHILFNK
jgi:glycosyltransferase involved in cell wall biosynthesis